MRSFKTVLTAGFVSLIAVPALAQGVVRTLDAGAVAGGAYASAGCAVGMVMMDGEIYQLTRMPLAQNYGGGYDYSVSLGGNYVPTPAPAPAAVVTETVIEEVVVTPAPAPAPVVVQPAPAPAPVQTVFSTYAGTYRVGALRTANGVISGVPALASLSVEVFADGRFSANGGCNTISGVWALQEDRLVLSDAAITERACVAPAPLEGAMQAAINAAARVRVVRDGAVLEFYDGNGAGVLALYR